MITHDVFYSCLITIYTYPFKVILPPHPMTYTRTVRLSSNMNIDILLMLHSYCENSNWYYTISITRIYPAFNITSMFPWLHFQVSSMYMRNGTSIIQTKQKKTVWEYFQPHYLIMWRKGDCRWIKTTKVISKRDSNPGFESLFDRSFGIRFVRG